ncbi:MAG: TonB-dependent receptor [Gammaproteobacteria bacterium]|nr:TonB-dependent receptor [Gammaproteobacteria bacterium]
MLGNAARTISSTRPACRRGCLCAALVLATAWTPAQALDQNPTELSLDELANAQVTTAARKAQPLSKTSAAVYVISRETIRDSGATSIPELLRRVPGVQVQQLDASKWAVSIRGFNSRLNNKLLVLIDGRPVYDHTLSGVYWEAVALPLDEIERIEVIRGPGGALWGANAVNGVINIITRPATDTLGGLVRAGVGRVEKGFATARHGMALGENAFGRIYLRARNRDESERVSGGEADDDWEQQAGGFHLDWQLSADDTLSLQGDSYDLKADQSSLRIQLDPPARIPSHDATHFYGQNLLGRWVHRDRGAGEWTVQVFQDSTHHSELVYGVDSDTFDLDAQHRLALSPGQELTWGLGYRRIQSAISGPNLTTVRGDEPFDVTSLFVSDQLSFWDDALQLTLGVKWEDHELVGETVQPNIRVNRAVNEDWSLWAAWGKAVRTPARSELDVALLALSLPSGRPSPALLGFYITGNPGLEPERMKASELGLRWLASDKLSIDLALFQNRYEDLVVSTLGPQFVDPAQGILRQDFFPTNTGEATAQGLELALHWLPLDWWSLSLNYARISLRADLPTASQEASQEASLEGGTPREQAWLQNSFQLAEDWELALILRHRDGLSSSTRSLPSRTDLELNLGWQAAEQLHLGLSGRNLSDNDEPDVLGGQIRIERSLYLTARYEF